MEYVQRTDTGVQFVCTIVDEQTNNIINLSQASNFALTFRKPDKSVYSVVASLYTDGTDGKISYLSQVTDLLLAGIWKFQASYTLSGSNKLTSWASFQVLPNLNDL